MYAEVFGAPMIIINSLDVAKTLLEKRGANYSDRPTLPMAGELVGYKHVTTLMRDKDILRAHRRLIAQVMGTAESVKRFHPMQEEEVLKFARAILASPSQESLSKLIR